MAQTKADFRVSAIHSNKTAQALRAISLTLKIALRGTVYNKRFNSNRLLSKFPFVVPVIQGQVK